MNATRLLLIVGLAAGLAGAAPVALRQPLAASRQSRATSRSPLATSREQDSRPLPPWAEHLKTWVTAVVEHEPGKADEPAHAIGSWSEPDVREVLDAIIALRAILKSEDERLAQLRAKSPTIPHTAPLVTYRKQQILLKELQDIFSLGGDEARRGDVNRLLRRGALLHADIAILSQSGAGGWPNVASGPPVVVSTDGRALGYAGSVIHWELGRVLLDALAPDPARDDTARLWYYATAAYMLSNSDLAASDPHLDHALRLFGTDADILFEGGYLHEVYASPRVQNAVQALLAQHPTLSSPLIGRSADAQLRDAEDLFRRAVRANPGLLEARVRLARVLSARGRYAEAAGELRSALEGSPEPVLRYYAEMLLGDAEQALGLGDAARDCYERAAALYPEAQSPQLALSHLARRGGDRAGALRSIQKALTPRPDYLWNSDPWFTYGIWQSRSADDLLVALRTRIVSEGLR